MVYTSTVTKSFYLPLPVAARKSAFNDNGTASAACCEPISKSVQYVERHKCPPHHAWPKLSNLYIDTAAIQPHMDVNIPCGNHIWKTIQFSLAVFIFPHCHFPFGFWQPKWDQSEPPCDLPIKKGWDSICRLGNTDVWASTPGQWWRPCAGKTKFSSPKLQAWIEVHDLDTIFSNTAEKWWRPHFQRVQSPNQFQGKRDNFSPGLNLPCLHYLTRTYCEQLNFCSLGHVILISVLITVTIYSKSTHF